MPITITVAQVREQSGLGNTKIWELISTGQLQTVRVGRRRLIIYSSLEKLLCPPAVTKTGDSVSRKARGGRKAAAP